MSRWFIVLVLLIVASCRPVVPRPNVPSVLCADDPARAGSAKEDCQWRRDVFIERGISSTVRILTVDQPRPGKAKVVGSGGTGVVIDDGHYVLTSFHVVKLAREINAMPREAAFMSIDEMAITEERPVRMSLVRFSVDKDVALLAPKDGGRLPRSVNVAPREYRVEYGDQLWHFGHVSGATRGTVAKTFVIGQDSAEGISITGLVSFTANSREGDSGGPIMRTDGALVGILFARGEKGGTYFVPIYDALIALGMVGPMPPH